MAKYGIVPLSSRTVGKVGRVSPVTGATRSAMTAGGVGKQVTSKNFTGTGKRATPTLPTK